MTNTEALDAALDAISQIGNDEAKLILGLRDYAKTQAAERRENDFYMALLHRFAECQSPIERVMLAALESVIGFSIWTYDGATAAKFLAENSGPPKWWIATQVPFGNYRVDLCLCHGGKPIIIVECDGHQFHERTAEQAQRDKSRDRTLQAVCRVFRFTGREIWRDPLRCAEEVRSASLAAAFPDDDAAD